MGTRNREIQWQQQEMHSVAPTNAKIGQRLQIVYGKDTFTSHDKMGDAQIIIKPFLEVHKLEVCKNFKVEQRSRESCPPEKLLV
ncbi:hypothetical protein YC2023_091939 [Brassica napus]